MASSLQEEMEERARHQPKIQVAMPTYYGVPTANGKWENTCRHTGMVLALTKDEWDARNKEFLEKQEAERSAKQQEEEAKRSEEGRKYAESLPKKQKYIRGANRAKRVLGRNNLVGLVLRNHDVVSDGGIIIPACVRETDRDFDEVMVKSTFIRVLAVSDDIDYKVHPWLREAKDNIKRGKRGPIVEINPGSGTPRRGDNGEACLFINAQFCWLEYPEPEEAPNKAGLMARLKQFLGFRGEGNNMQTGERA